MSWILSNGTISDKRMVQVDEEGQGDVEIFDAELRRQLTLTTPDLRFCDFILKSMEVNRESTPSKFEFLYA